MATVKKPRILFISHSYPPTFGGLERQNQEIFEALSKITETKLIANTRGKKFLPIFIAWAFLKSLFILSNYDVALFGNGIPTPIAIVLRFFYPRKKYIAIIHGLDVTFAKKKSILGRIYRSINIPSLKKFNRLIMVGNETIEEAVKAGVPRDLCVFIPNGINPESIIIETNRQEMEKVLDMNLTGKKIILRVARFVPHKGVEWFIRNVMPALPENYVFVSAGGVVSSAITGNENAFDKCQKAARELHLEDRVKLIGNIPEKDKLVLFNATDLYVSPNIKVHGTMEGFGINAIEAAVCERVVLASNHEGLKDAIIEGRNGFLVEPGNANAWIEKIKELLEDDEFRKEFGKKAKQFVMENFVWEKISQRYLEEIEKTLC
ncbi:MAG: glycosyltransferase family 4 protein [Parcubacteria group bacterium]|jgi:glycosyltransferase involved in cell wall biosynthesis